MQSIANLTNETEIGVVFEYLGKVLGLVGMSELGYEELQREWVELFYEHLIYNVGLLRRLNPLKLRRLGLPLLIENELQKIIDTGRIRNSVVDISLLTVKSSSSHSEAANRIQSRQYKCGLTLTPEQKEAIRYSWFHITSEAREIEPETGFIGPSKASGLTKFARAFYPIFFKNSPESKRLFENSDLESQVRALTNILSWIVINLDNISKLGPVLAQMGGRHEIYGVHQEEYLKFSKSVGETFKHLGGPEVSNLITTSWELCINEISELMMSLAKKVQLGFRAEINLEKSHNAWIKNWATLTLDTLYLFRNESFTELSSQYNLQMVEEVVFPGEDNLPGFCFELVIPNPGIRLRFSAVDGNSFQDWVFELGWRIQALKKVPHPMKAPDQDSESGTSSYRKSSKNPKRSNSKKSAPHVTIEPFTGLKITEKQKALMMSSWHKILSTQFDHPDYKRGLDLFVLEFYPKFFGINPSGRRLFMDTPMEVQSRALTKMLAMIVSSIDIPQSLQETMHSLGGRHQIYGVQPADYDQFTVAICETIEIVLFKCQKEGIQLLASPSTRKAQQEEPYTPALLNEIKETWKLVMDELSKMMIKAGHDIQKKGLKAVVLRKLRRDGNWKKSVITLTLDTLFIYRDEKMVKLQSSYPLREIVDIDTEVNPNCSPPTKHGMTLELKGYRFILLAFDDENTCSNWLSELSWHVQALNRCYKEQEDSEGDTSQSSYGSSFEIGYRSKVKANRKNSINSSPKKFKGSPTRSPVLSKAISHKNIPNK